METKKSKTTGRILGIIYLLLLVSGGIGLGLKGLPLPTENSTLFFEALLEIKDLSTLSYLLEVIAALLGLAIPLLLRKRLQHWRQTTIFFVLVTLLIINLVVVVLQNETFQALLSFNQPITTEPITTEIFQSRLNFLEEYYTFHWFALIAFSSASCFIYYHLGFSKAIPKYLVIWGFIASISVIGATIAQLFGLKANFLFYAINGLFMLTFTITLLIIGLRPVKTSEVQP